MKYIILMLFPVLSLFPEIKSQIQTTYRAETFASVASGENTPFWMLYHNWGMVPIDANNFYAKGGIFHQQIINREWSFNAGLDLAVSSPHSYGRVWVQQFFGELNWKFLRLNAGSKEDYVSLLNQYLSSGDFNMSNHARPVPKVKASIPHFTLIPYTKGNMFIKGEFAVGYCLDGKWQENIARPNLNSYTKNAMVHHKSFYLRFGNIEEKNRLQFTFGLDHQAFYGGDLYYGRNLFETDPTEYVVQNQPKGLDELFRVVIAKEGSLSSSIADQAYTAGSSTGAYLFKFDYSLKNRSELSVYKQHFFDDGSGMAFENYRDGLYGIEYRTKSRALLSGAVLEYVYTKNQTGPIHFNLEMDDEHYHLRSKGNGNDSYYNNVDFVQGHSHFGRTRGTPLFLSPEYNRDGRLNFTGTRIIAFHIGIEGYFHSTLKYRLLATTGRNWGLYYVPFTSVKKGFASVVDFIYIFPKFDGLDLKISVGSNKGEFFGDNSFGGGLAVTKRGNIFQR